MPFSVRDFLERRGGVPRFRQFRIARIFLVQPFRELVAGGYVTNELEYRSYPALWKALSSRPDAPTDA